MEKINSLTGMFDLISSKSDQNEFANKIFSTEESLRVIFENFSLCEIRTPALETTNLFKRSVGDTSDIVNKELYTFLDKNEKSISLRPEGTASVIRSVVEKKLDGQLHKLWYLGPMWRYERPQKGRFRQFNQAGVEILGYEEGVAEFDLVSLICSINKHLKIHEPILKINHLGDKDTKKEYCKALTDFLKPVENDLDEKDQERLKKNPLRILDSKNEEIKKILVNAPSISDFLPSSSIDLLTKLKKTFSEDCNIQIDYNLVRGLDYYTGFVFEAISSDLGSQDAYIGGGRYDNLCKNLGGKDLPAIGMAIGIERLALISNYKYKNKTSISFIIISGNDESKAFKIAHDLRALNKQINIDVQLSYASLKSKLRKANKNNASYVVIIGDEELNSNTAILKSLKEKDSEQSILKIDELKKFILNLE